MNDEELAVIVIDNGSGRIKAGFAGDDEPCLVFPSVVGRPNQASKDTEGGEQLNDSYVGSDAQSRREVLRIKHPIDGVIVNWEDMEEVWRYTFRELKVDPSERSVLLTEPMVNPKAYREKVVQMMFETFDTPSMYLANQALLSYYACGRSVGLVLDSGDSGSQVVPFYEGYALMNATYRPLPVSGRNLTDLLGKMLEKRGYSFPSKDREYIVRPIKEQLCYVALDYDKEMAASSTSPEVSYNIPEGQVISIGNERFRCPEALFETSLLGYETCGIHEMIVNSIMKCDIDLRRAFFCNIILSGGNTMFPGLAERLEKEVAASLPTNMSNVPVHVVAQPDRTNSVWIGGSILGSLSTFEQIRITREEYEETGPTIVHTKCF